jgi:putative SOS response-associated peptidase YedK
MCGRYSLVRGDKIKVVFNVTVPANLRLLGQQSFFPDDVAPVITAHSPDLELFRWGLIPRWFKGAKITRIEKEGKVRLRLDIDPELKAQGKSLRHTFNAKVETLAEKPTFRDALAQRRCLIPADGFYEWRTDADGKRKPVYITMRDGEPFAFAGLWDTWHDAAGAEVKSFTMITTPPNALIEPIHNRMPAIVPREGYADWLEHGSMEWLKPYPAEQMQIEQPPAEVTPVAPARKKSRSKADEAQGSLF